MLIVKEFGSGVFVSVDFAGDRNRVESTVTKSMKNCWVFGKCVLQVLIVEELRSENKVEKAKICGFTDDGNTYLSNCQ